MPRTLRHKKGIVTNMAGAELFSRQKQDRPRNVYEFDGTQNIAIPEWLPRGHPFEVELICIDEAVDGVMRNALDAADPGMSLMRTSGNFYRNLYVDVAGVQITMTENTGPLPEVGKQVRHGYAPRPSDWAGRMYIDGVDVAGNSAVSGPTLGNGITAIGSNAGGSAKWKGLIWDVKLTDLSPIQNRWVQQGNSDRYVELANEIVIPAGADFEVSWDQIWVDTNTGVLGNDSNHSYVFVYGTGGTPPLGMRVRIADTNVQTSVPTPLDVLASGQHCKFKVSRTITSPTSAEFKFYLDNVLLDTVATGAAPTAEAIFTHIGYNSLSQTYPTGVSVANVRITDITNDREWFYPLDRADLTASVGAQRNSVFAADLTGNVYGYDGVSGACLLDAYGLEGNTIEQFFADSTDTATLVLSQVPLKPPTLSFGKLGGIAFSGGPLLWNAVIPGIHKALADAEAATDVNEQYVRLVWEEKGIQFNSLDAPNTGKTQDQDYDGIWTPDADGWLFIESNNRHYPINEGSGLVVKNVLDESGDTDGAIVGGDGGWTVRNV